VGLFLAGYGGLAGHTLKSIDGSVAWFDGHWPLALLLALGFLALHLDGTSSMIACLTPVPPTPAGFWECADGHGAASAGASAFLSSPVVHLQHPCHVNRIEAPDPDQSVSTFGPRSG